MDDWGVAKKVRVSSKMLVLLASSPQGQPFDSVVAYMGVRIRALSKVAPIKIRSVETSRDGRREQIRTRVNSHAFAVIRSETLASITVSLAMHLSGR